MQIKIPFGNSSRDRSRSVQVRTQSKGEYVAHAKRDGAAQDFYVPKRASQTLSGKRLKRGRGAAQCGHDGNRTPGFSVEKTARLQGRRGRKGRRRRAETFKEEKTGPMRASNLGQK